MICMKYEKIDPEFEMEWRRGRLAKAIPYIVFHADDMTYSGGA